jgi:SAM-dependent methyltransferase
MAYHQDLQILKSSFIGGGEGAFYLRMLDRLPLRHIDWLDIGIGRSADAVIPFIEYCGLRGTTVSVTGIDPNVDTAPPDNAATRWRFIRSRFESWDLDSQFDLVNADQSLYYFGDLPRHMARIAAGLRPGGLFIATCWSRDDTLHRIRERLFPHADRDLVAEDLTPLIESCGEFQLLENATYRTKVDLARWRGNRERLEAAVRVIARAEIRADIESLTDHLSQILDDIPQVAPRINTAVGARKR